MKKIVIAVVLVGVIALIGSYFWQNNDPKLHYLTETVALGDIQTTVIAGGQVYAEELIDVGAQATGRVDKLHVSLGQQIKKGDLIADIDATQQNNALKDEEASYKMLLAQHDTKKIQLDQLKDEFDKQQQAFHAGILPKIEYLKAKSALSATKNELLVSQTQLEQARLKIATAKTNLGYTRIRAPIDGVVVSVVTKEGQTINAMQSSPTIIKLAQIDTVHIKAKFSEADISKLKTGMKAYFSVLGLPNQKFEATLDSLELAPIGDSSAVYYYGQLSVPNPNHEFLIGMTANVTVIIDEQNQVLSIPMTALGEQISDNEYKVQVIDDENAKTPQIETRTVKIGANNKINAQVLSGLEQGDKVILSSSDGEVDELDMDF